MDQPFQHIADEIRAKIDAHCQTYDDGNRTHLGASLIGDECAAKLWFVFRWIWYRPASGRMNRIFDTGHKEEKRIVDWVKAAGFEVIDIDPATGKQFVVSDVNGHFGGSGDGIVGIPGLGNILLECKSNKGGSEFKHLIDDGVRKAKPKHWAQICTYGYKFNIKYCLYICKNKDNDDLHIEIVELDFEEGIRNISKASDIIVAKARPSRISESPAFFACKMCNKSEICHKPNTQVDKNCRSCKFASPCANAEWYCEHWNSIIPKEAIPNGCDNWKGIF